MTMGKIAASGQQHIRMPSVMKMDESHGIVLGCPKCPHRSTMPNMTPDVYKDE